MRVIRLGIVVLVVLAGCGVASAQEGPDGPPDDLPECPAGLIAGDVITTYIGAVECGCPDTGELVGSVSLANGWTYGPMDDGDCSTPFPPEPVEDEPPAVEAVAVVPTTPVAASAGSVLRRTG